MTAFKVILQAQMNAMLWGRVASPIVPEFARGGTVNPRGEEVILPRDPDPQYEYHLGPNFKKEQTKMNDVDSSSNNVININAGELLDEEAHSNIRSLMGGIASNRKVELD